MPMFKFFKANIARFSSIVLSERLATNIFKNAKTSVATVIAEYVQIGKKLEQRSIGSGVVWDIEGHIVTSYHVIREHLFKKPEDRKDYEVYILTPEGVEEKYIGMLVGANYEESLAVLKINAPKSILKPITVGESTVIEVGQTCFAIGAPYSYRHSFTTGIISGLNPNRSRTGNSLISGMIQTDAYTDAESSGGPLLNSEGHMIGISTRGYSGKIGFAIPSSVVVKIIPQLIKYYKAKCPGLNIAIADDYLCQENANWTGAMVIHVTPHSRASGFLNSNLDKLIKHDIIISVGDKPVTTKWDLFEILEEYRAGDTIILTVMRGQTLTLILSIPFEDY